MSSAIPTDTPARFHWATRWTYLTRAVEMDAETPVVVALSGGADSVLLLHLAVRSQPAPRVLAVHVDHGLRGPESEADAQFCRNLCEGLGVPFECRSAPLDPSSSNLEARARELRYAALAAAAGDAGIETLVTGHHRDDQLETLLMRWLRGSDLAGLPGLRARSERSAQDEDGPALTVARPLIGLRSAEIREILTREGIEWREDSSNASRRFTRNRVRSELIPRLAEEGGDETLENLFRFAAAVEGLEDELASRTAHLAWSPPAWATASRSEHDARLGGTLPRKDLSGLPSALQRRALWRLLQEGTGLAPSAPLIDLVLEDLEADRRTRRDLPGSFRLLLRADSIHLVPPPPTRASHVHQPSLPFPAFDGQEDEEALRLGLPGLATLPDGRAIQAEIVSVAGAQAVPRRADEVELDPGDGLDEVRELTVRWARPGDRFHGLGAPGSRPLGRFFADAGIPREERGRIPLVFADDELIWVAGLRPSEHRRVRAGMGRRLRLRLLGAAAEALPPVPDEGAELFGA